MIGMKDSFEQPSLSNEALVELAHGATDSLELFGLGAILDERITTKADELRRIYSDTDSIPVDGALEHSDLMRARQAVNAAYGSRTGHQRGACNMGAPVPFRRPN